MHTCAHKMADHKDTKNVKSPLTETRSEKDDLPELEDDENSLPYFGNDEGNPSQDLEKSLPPKDVDEILIGAYASDENEQNRLRELITTFRPNLLNNTVDAPGQPRIRNMHGGLRIGELELENWPALSGREGGRHDLLSIGRNFDCVGYFARKLNESLQKQNESSQKTNE